MELVPITTKAASSNLAHGEEHSIQHYVIKIVSCLRLVGGFIWYSGFSINNIDRHDMTEIFLKVALRHHNT
jgi:hypothetical protein